MVQQNVYLCTFSELYMQEIDTSQKLWKYAVTRYEVGAIGKSQQRCSYIHLFHGPDVWLSDNDEKDGEKKSNKEFNIKHKTYQIYDTPMLHKAL